MILDRLETRFPGLKVDGDPNTVPDTIWQLTKQLDIWIREKDRQQDEHHVEMQQELTKIIQSLSKK